MEKTDTNAAPPAIQRDLAAGCARTAITWGPGVLMIIAAGQFGPEIRTIGWTAGLAWLAGFCLLNYARCGRVHCLFAGPFFLAMAALTPLIGLGVLSAGRNAWNVLGAVILAGGVFLTCVPEMLWGRYWQRAS